MTDATRTPTPIDTIADAWVDTLAELDPHASRPTSAAPNTTTDIGDYTPAGHERSSPRRRARRSRALEAATPVDDIDAVTQVDLSRELELELDLHDAKWHLRDLNVIASPAQDIRSVSRPHAHRDGRRLVRRRRRASAPSRRARRLHRRPCAKASRRASFPRGARSSRSSPRSPLHRATTASSRRSPAEAAPADGQLPASLARELADNANAARVVYDELAQFLGGELAPVGEREGCRRARTLRTAVAPVPRRHDRPRRDLRLGRGGARPHGRRAGVDRERDQGRRHASKRPSRSSRRTRRASCTAPTRCSDGCRRRATVPSPSSARPTSTSPSRSARSSA